jgi:hypothetical protein
MLSARIPSTTCTGRRIGQRLDPGQAQFGKEGGKLASFTDQQYCEELRRVDTRFQELTGHKLDPFWRAPGGYTSPRTLAAGSACGYQHAGWAPAGFPATSCPAISIRTPCC